MKIDLSIIIPALREEKIIGSTLTQLADFLRAHKELGEIEVIVVAANAGDRTKQVAQEHAHLFPHFKVIDSGRRVGKGHDVQAGLLAARGEKRIFTDADLATPLRHIPRMAKALDEHDVVVGTRNLRTIHKGLVRRFLSEAGTLLIRTILLPSIKDSQCGFKGFRAAAAEQIFGALKTTGWGFDMEVLARAKRAGLTIEQIPINDWHEAREQGLQGDNKTRVAVQSLVELARIKCMLTLERRPLMRKLWWLIPVVAFMVAGLLFSYNIGKGSIWFDEAFSTTLIQFSPLELIRLTALDVHPPLYYLVLQVWAELFGTSEAAVRSLSAICMIAAMAVGFVFVRRYFGKRASYVVLPFMVLAPFLLRYAQEARMYAMATLVCIAATYILARVHQKSTTHKPLWWVGYALLVVAGLYIHYYTALIWIAHWAWHLYMVRQSGEKFFSKAWFWTHAAVFIAFLPWLPIFVKQFAGVQAGFWIGPVSHQTLLNIASNVLVYHQQWELIGWWSVMFVAVIAGLSSLLYRTYKSLQGDVRAHFALLMACAFIPVVVLFVLSLPPLKPVLVERYFVPAVLSFSLLIGAAIAIGPAAKRWYQSKMLLGALVLGCFSFGAAHVYAVSNYNYNQEQLPNAKNLMAAIEPQTNADTAIVANSPYAYYEFAYYTTKDRTYFLDADNVLGNIGSGAMLVGNPHLVKNLAAFGETKQYIWIAGAGKSLYVDPPSGWQELETVKVGDYLATRYKTGF